jgi:hypothetical protein
MRTALTYRVMKSVIITFIVCCCLGSSSAWAIDCLSAAGDPKTGWYSWREIEGRRCWFKKTGAMPPKSQLHWPARVRQEVGSIEPASASNKRIEPAVMTPSQADTTNRPEPQSPTLPRFMTVRVKPATGTLRLGNSQVDLMNGASLSTMQPLGKARQKPTNLAPADQFNARFNGQ